VMNGLYFYNLIPPIPLSLKDSGVYYEISKDANSQYVGRYEKTDWKSYFIMYDDFRINPGASVYAYSAVFSPTDLNTTIRHVWQYHNEYLGKWVDYSRVELPLFGGRGGGFRTYSVKTGLIAGQWRVNVENIRGQVIGRIRFNIVPTEGYISTQTKVLE